MSSDSKDSYSVEEEMDDRDISFSEELCYETDTEEGTSSSDATSEDELEELPEDDWGPIDTRKKFSFTSEASTNLHGARTPLDFFKLLFNTNFVNLLVSIINARALQFAIKVSNDTKSIFKPTNKEEVYTFLAVYLFMGNVKVHPWSYYWGAHPLYNLKFENFISQSRFYLLMRSLAFKEKLVYTDHGDSRRSWYDAAKPIADSFNSIMKSLVTPGKELNIDKCTAHWFNEMNVNGGRRKPERIKMHLLSDKNGVFLRVHLCHPNGDNKGDEIAKALMTDFVNSGRSLYSCPFYTSVTLAEDLLDNKTHLTGILKANKHRNPSIVRKRLKIGAVKTIYNRKGVCVSNFRKSHTILGLSTEFSGELVRGKHLYPEMALHFRENTKSMFKRNQSLSDNSPSSIPKRYNRTILYILQVMFMNSYLLYKTGRKRLCEDIPKKSFYDFRRDIIQSLLPLPKDDGSDSDIDTDTSLLLHEVPDKGDLIHLPREVVKDKKRVRNCRQCWLEHGIRTKTQYYCAQCPQKWRLCLSCFRQFHRY